MSIKIAAQYLTIEWQEPGQARRVEVGPEPVEIERTEDGTLRLEVEIFPEDHAWLGLKLSGVLANATPAWNAPDGRHHPLIAVTDTEGARWWVPALEWDGDAKRHQNAFYRSFGTFTVAVGEQWLEVVAITHGCSRVVLEDYLRDFQNDLIWLVLGFDGTGAASGAGQRADQPLVAALGDFTTALSRIATRPASEMHEISGAASIAKLRPNAATFRQHARTPTAPRLPSRLAEESADIPDNRFLRHMTTICTGLARSLGQAAERQTDLLEGRARVEAKRGEDYRQTEFQSVDPDVFDRQLAETEERLGEVKRWSSDQPIPADVRQQEFPVRLTKVYSKTKDEFFYERLSPGQPTDYVKYSVVRLPEALASLIFGVLHFGRGYTFRGTAKSNIEVNSKGEPFRRLELQRVSSVEPHSQAVENKRRKRAELEQNGWRTRLKPEERAEYQKAARTAEMRSAKFREMAEHAERAGTTLCESLSALRRIDLGLQALGIGTSPQMPTGMRFSMHPDYAACLSAYHRVQALASRSGLGESALGAVERIGTMHASALYERWCLVKILIILTTEFGFRQPPGWQEQLIAAVTGPPQPFSLVLCRPEINFGALFEVQPRLGNGRRPDFRVRFAPLLVNLARTATGGLAPSDLTSLGGSPGLIMDAKFRTRWKLGEMERVLETLIAQKRYDSEGDRVFLLHPVAGTMRAPTSPLEWGAHCDYGHDPKCNHRRGTIWLAPDAGQSDAQRHLRRLIGLELQASFPKPTEIELIKGRETILNVGVPVSLHNGDGIFDDFQHEEKKIWISRSFCLSCGKAHGPEDIVARRARSNHIYWDLGCSACEMATTRTHCFGPSCNTILFKNLIGATYHRTIANQPTNVVCPSCGAYFDKDWSGESERDKD